MLRANPDGSFVRVRDVARVELAARRLESFGRLDGSPAAVIGIYQTPGGNAINSADADPGDARTAEGVIPARRRLQNHLRHHDLRQGEHQQRPAYLVRGVRPGGGRRLLFLGNFRATLIPLIAVPVSLIGTFAVMLALGFSANTVSLLALVLAIGIVVDDAIVVVEAVEAQLEKDHTISPAEARAGP